MLHRVANYLLLKKNYEDIVIATVKKISRGEDIPFKCEVALLLQIPTYALDVPEEPVKVLLVCC